MQKLNVRISRWSPEKPSFFSRCLRALKCCRCWKRFALRSAQMLLKACMCPLCNTPCLFAVKKFRVLKTRYRTAISLVQSPVRIWSFFQAWLRRSLKLFWYNDRFTSVIARPYEIVSFEEAVISENRWHKWDTALARQLAQQSNWQGFLFMWLVRRQA